LIAGIGTDIVSVARMQAAIDRWGLERFARRLLTESELRLLSDHPQPASFLAKRFAGKEAAVKALGTGFRYGISLKDIQLLNDPVGKPLLSFNGQAEQLSDERGIVSHHVSLSDEDAYATAFVVLECESR